MICSCGKRVVAGTSSYVGTQVFPFVVLCLFNCSDCGSTRAAVLHEAFDEFDAEQEPIAAE